MLNAPTSMTATRHKIIFPTSMQLIPHSLKFSFTFPPHPPLTHHSLLAFPCCNQPSRSLFIPIFAGVSPFFLIVSFSSGLEPPRSSLDPRSDNLGFQHLICSCEASPSQNSAPYAPKRTLNATIQATILNKCYSSLAPTNLNFA